MNNSSLTDLIGQTVDAVYTDADSHIVTINSTLSETGYFDGAGGWIEHEVPLFQESHSLTCTGVEVVDTVELIVHTTIENITVTPSKNNTQTIIITAQNKVRATIVCHNFQYR